MAALGARQRTRYGTGVTGKPVPKPPPSQPLSEEDQRELQTAFVVLDQNKDGRLSAEDLRKSLNMLGMSVDKTAADGFVSKVAHGGNWIREHEFLSWVESNANNSKSAVLRNAFTALDQDNDGLITQHDLSRGFELLGLKISDLVLALMFNEADSNKDGKVDFEDFLKVLEDR